MILKFDGEKLSASPYGKDYRCLRVIYPLFTSYNLHYYSPEFIILQLSSQVIFQKKLFDLTNIEYFLNFY